MSYNFKITIAYDGTSYGGWQIQPNAPTIQEILQKNFKVILRHDVMVIGSGRTDAGVHALAQVAHFKHSEPIDKYRFLGSINGLLPQDIRVKNIESVPLDFHAQYSAISKTYHYHLHLEYIQDPFHRLYRLHVREKVDIQRLKEAAILFVGRHDFTSFANEAHAGCAVYDPVRTLKRLDVFDEEGGVRLEFEADGFLYKMVRNIVGTLLEIGAGKRGLEEVGKIFAAKDRRKAGKAAPPHGLFLVRVDYPS
jgi:tRNA pseudouridine38-40 synthase